MSVIKDRNGVELAVGDKVRHFDREGEGIITAIDPERLPLIDVDFGDESIRGIPVMDILQCPKLTGY